MISYYDCDSCCSRWCRDLFNDGCCYGGEDEDVLVYLIMIACCRVTCVVGFFFIVLEGV